MLQSWNPWKIKVYFYLIATANEYDREWRGITIKRGQTIRSLRKIQDAVSYIIQYSSDTNRNRKPSISTVKRVIEDLKVKHLIDVEVVHDGMLITVNHYEYLSNVPITKMVHKNLGKVKQQNAPLHRVPKWMKDEGLI